MLSNGTVRRAYRYSFAGLLYGLPVSWLDRSVPAIIVAESCARIAGSPAWNAHKETGLVLGISASIAHPSPERLRSFAPDCFIGKRARSSLGCKCSKEGWRSRALVRVADCVWQPQRAWGQKQTCGLPSHIEG